MKKPHRKSAVTPAAENNPVMTAALWLKLERASTRRLERIIRNPKSKTQDVIEAARVVYDAVLRYHGHKGLYP